MTETKRCTDVWEILTPEEAPAMRLRSALLRALSKHLKHAMAAVPAPRLCRELCISLGTLHDITSGKIDRFGYDQLVDMCRTASLDVEQIISNAMRRTQE